MIWGLLTRETIYGVKNEFCFYNLNSVNLPVTRACVISQLLLSMTSIKDNWRTRDFHVAHSSVNWTNLFLLHYFLLKKWQHQILLCIIQLFHSGIYYLLVLPNEFCTPFLSRNSLHFLKCISKHNIHNTCKVHRTDVTQQLES